jgi:hypothetical protein
MASSLSNIETVNENLDVMHPCFVDKNHELIGALGHNCACWKDRDPVELAPAHAI